MSEAYECSVIKVNRGESPFEASRRSYVEELQQPGLTDDQKDHIRSQIKVLDIIINTTEDDRCRLFDRTIFNDIVIGYVKLALFEMGADEELKHDVLNRLAFCFDWYRAKAALNYHKDHLF